MKMSWKNCSRRKQVDLWPKNVTGYANSSCPFTASQNILDGHALIGVTSYSYHIATKIRTTLIFALLAFTKIKDQYARIEEGRKIAANKNVHWQYQKRA